MVGRKELHSALLRDIPSLMHWPIVIIALVMEYHVNDRLLLQGHTMDPKGYSHPHMWSIDTSLIIQHYHQQQHQLNDGTEQKTYTDNNDDSDERRMKRARVDATNNGSTISNSDDNGWVYHYPVEHYSLLYGSGLRMMDCTHNRFLVASGILLRSRHISVLQRVARILMTNDML